MSTHKTSTVQQYINRMIKVSARFLYISWIVLFSFNLRHSPGQYCFSFQTLLEDPVVVVRATTVQGVFKILNLFWELIPAAVIQSFLIKLLQDLAWDSASSDVRVAVLVVSCVKSLIKICVKKIGSCRRNSPFECAPALT